MIFFGLDPHYLEGCCTEFQIKKGTTKLPSLERLVREFERKGPSERLTPEAHDRFRRVLGKLAWSSLTRPDLAFVVGYLGRFQAAPTEAAEHAMRVALRWVLGLPPMVQRFPSERVSLKNECDPREITLFVDASWSLDSTSGGIVSWMAMDQANLLDFEKGDMWAQRLLRARMTDPPPLFARPSWKQLAEADRKLFSELRDRARSGVQADPSGRPLDRNIVAVMESYNVSCLLQPVPTAAGKAELEDHVSKRAHPYGGSTAGRGKGRGSKGKGKGSGNVKLPPGLEGCRSSTNRGEPICFAHNLGHCSNPVTNGRCMKGLRVCAVLKCGAHSHWGKHVPQEEGRVTSRSRGFCYRSCSSGCIFKFFVRQ